MPAAAPPHPTATALRQRPRSLAQELVEALEARLRSGDPAAGQRLPTEVALMAEFAVSRTVVREALSRLQAAGWVETRHGIGTFALAQASSPVFHVSAQQRETLHEVVATLELRIAIESESAALAAARRTDEQLATLHARLRDLDLALQNGLDSAPQDHAFHIAVAEATHNPRFADLLRTLGVDSIPRARLGGPVGPSAAQRHYLRRVQDEHQAIYDAIARQDPEAARAAMRAHLVNSRERRVQSRND